MPVIFNKDTNKENQPNPNEIINKIIKVIKELEQTINELLILRSMVIISL